MSRFDTAYIEIEDKDGVGVFELNIGLQLQGEHDKNFLMGQRGQYVTEAINLIEELGSVDGNANRRAGYKIDGGAGTWTEMIQFETGLEGVTWGDGSGGTGPSNVTTRDASGKDVKPLTRFDILALWINRAKTDSANPARVYRGEWATGKHHSEAGAFNQAMPVSINNFQPEMPDPKNDPPSTLRGTIGVQLITPFSDYELPDWWQNSNIGSYAKQVTDGLKEIADE